MGDRLERLDYYTLLGVPMEAGVPEIKTAFRSFARRYHPDQHTGKPEEKVERATQIYRRGSEAYQVLLDPVARRAYDQNLKAGKLRLSAEERERALAEVKAAAGPKKKVQPIRSPQALMYYEQAAAAARDRKWREAWKLMKQAVAAEPNNPLLDTRLRQLEARLRRGAV
ncbi:MAG: DnaJ domain-containing protein [Sandaracinaceae bacterium]